MRCALSLLPDPHSLLAAGLVLLSGCGGGGGGEAAAPAPPPPAAPTFASLGSNGSFEQGLTGWTQLGSTSGVQFSLVTDAKQGGSALRVSGRSRLDHGPGQNLFSSQLAAAQGTPFTTRFWIKVDAPAMARCLVSLTTDQGTSRLVLAEAVVRSADQWVEVEGTVPLAWSGTLTQAALEFSVGQPAEQIHPSFTLDDVRIQRDGDADGLPDTNEPGAAATSADRDGDGLPDGWETRQSLDPDRADASADADGDGFTNHQEYWAATNPQDAASRPGIPCTSGADARVATIVRNLALLPSLSVNRVVSGQHLTGISSQGGLAGEYAANVQALKDQTGYWPGLLSLQYEGGDATVGPLQEDRVGPYAKDWAAAGGLVLIKFQPFDPWSLAIQSTAGDPHVDLPGLLDPATGHPANLAANTAAHDRWMDWLDRMATALDKLQQAGVVVLWRPLSEMNASSHWHSRQPRDAWIALWRHMHDYFGRQRGLKNLVWVYEGDAFAHANVPADYYYPGDDVVDLMGHNLYDDDWVLPHDLHGIFRRYPKIYGFPQAGSSAIRDGSWDNLVLIQGIRARFPRASLFCTWNDFSNGGTFNARSMVSQRNAAALLSDPWVITREELGW